MRVHGRIFELIGDYESWELSQRFIVEVKLHYIITELSRACDLREICG